MKVTYKDKIVAFIDVLGFSEMVFSNDTTKLNKFFTVFSEEYKEVSKNKGLKYIIISDSIVISINNTKENFVKLSKTLSITQRLLLRHGILIRGGISFGDLYTNKSQNIVVGPGMIKAYKLEQKAKLPRIIIDRAFINLYFGGTNDLVETAPLTFRYKQPFPYKDDYVYLNYIAAIDTHFYRTTLNSFLDHFKESYYKNDTIDKYEWVKIHLIEEFQRKIDFLESNYDNKDNNYKQKLKFLNKLKML